MAKTSNPKRKEKYSAQRAITEVNRKRKREKHLRNYPNDLQIKKLLDS